MSVNRDHVRALAQSAISAGKPTEWFDECYRHANGDPTTVPWADMIPNPALSQWINEHASILSNVSNAIIVGCGLGDNAEALSNMVEHVTAFDVSPRAIDSKRTRALRHPRLVP